MAFLLAPPFALGCTFYWSFFAYSLAYRLPNLQMHHQKTASHSATQGRSKWFAIAMSDARATSSLAFIATNCFNAPFLSFARVMVIFVIMIIIHNGQRTNAATCARTISYSVSLSLPSLHSSGSIAT